MTSRMTATDELRRLLDERGVEHRQTEWIDGITVKWRGSDGSEYVARHGLSFDGPTGGLVLYDLTPAQAVEATLGSDLQAENAKLRELVLDYEELTAKLCDSRECDECPFDTESTMCKHMHMLLRVGELGVDV